MKKTLIAVLAFSGVAMAEFSTSDIVNLSDAAKFTAAAATNNGKTCDDNSNISFGDNMTLDSWSIEFTLTAPNRGWNKVLFSSERTGGGVTPAGLILMSWANPGNASLPAMVAVGWVQPGNGNNPYGTAPNPLEMGFSETVNEVTLTFAYDAQNKMAYLYNKTTEQLQTYEVTAIPADYTPSADSLKLETGSLSGSSYQVGVSTMWANGQTMTINSLYDLTNAASAGDNEGFKKFIMAPEPATATLSLLALAGLAARRRRH